MPRKRVLIADDSELMRKTIASFMEREPDIEVCALTATGMDTLNTALALRPDLLILDLQMPVLNGVEIAGVLHKSLPQTKTVLFTLYENTLSRRLASASGVSAVLSKTEGLIALSKAVRTLLADKLREAEETLGRASRERRVDPKDLEALSQQLNAPLTRCSRDLKYLWANQHYADWLQRPVDEIVGRPIVDVLGKSAFQVLERHFEQALRGTGVVYDEAADFEKIGRRHVLAAYKPTIRPDGSVDGWVAYVEDRTENTSENTTEHAGTMQLAPEPSEPAAPNSVNAN